MKDITIEVSCLLRFNSKSNFSTFSLSLTAEVKRYAMDSWVILE
jgi:hypothetical protein